MKNKLILLIAFVMVFCTLPAVGFAADAYEPYTIGITGFTYENASGVKQTTLNAGELVVSCDVEKIFKNDGKTVNCLFFTVVKKNGRIISRDDDFTSLSKNEKISLSNTVTIPANTTGVKVESYFWDSYENGKALAPKATFGSTENSLKAIYVDGKRIEGFDGSSLAIEKLLPASYAHTPDIVAVAKDSSANISIEEVTRLPQVVKLAITPSKGEAKTYGVNLKLPDGSVTNAYMLDASGAKKAVTVDKLRHPYYGTDEEGNEITPESAGFDYEKTMPVSKTLAYTDRTMYYINYPVEFYDAVAVQTHLQFIRYADSYKAAENKDAVMGEFTIDRSANVYIFAARPFWAEKDGYVLDSNAKIGIYYTGQGSRNPVSYTGYKRTVIVPEGETVNVRLGSVVNSNGGNATDYFMLVDFIDPSEFYGLSNISVKGVSDFVFSENQYEYEIELNEGVTVQPDILYETYGIGTTVEVNSEVTVPGKTTLTVKSVDSSKEPIVYTFNFKTFETALNDIKINGASVEGFDKNTYEYTYKLPFGWSASNGFPVVEGIGGSYVQVENLQADESSMEAVITVSSDKGATKTYKVKFEETLVRPSENVMLSFGGTNAVIYNKSNVYSATEQSVATVFGYANGYLSAYNAYTPATRTDYVPVLGYIQLDLTKMTGEIDWDTPITLRIHSVFSRYDAESTGSTPDDMSVSVYDLTGFDWANLDRTTRATATDFTAIAGKTPLFTFKESELTNTYAVTTKSTAGDVDIDITSIVKGWLDNGITNPTLCFKVNAGAPAPGKPNSQGNRMVYKMYFGARNGGAARNTYIIYNKFSD